MPSRQTGLPEGTDHIIDTNIDLGEGSGGGVRGAGGGKSRAAAKPAAAKTKASAFQFDKDNDEGGSVGNGIVGQVREQISTLTGQASDKARAYADDGKSKATGLLQSLAEVLADASGSVEDKLGGQYAGAGRKASESIKSLAANIDDKSVDELLADARAFVERSPVVAIGIAAVLGFAVARIVRSSVTEYRDGDA